MLPFFRGLEAMIRLEAHSAQWWCRHFTWKLQIQLPWGSVWKSTQVAVSAKLMECKYVVGNEDSSGHDEPISLPLRRRRWSQARLCISQNFGVPSIGFRNISCCLCFMFGGGDCATDTGTLHEITALTSGPRACKQNHLGPPHETLNK